jgi:hypothetical protein
VSLNKYNLFYYILYYADRLQLRGGHSRLSRALNRKLQTFVQQLLKVHMSVHPHLTTRGQLNRFQYQRVLLKFVDAFQFWLKSGTNIGSNSLNIYRRVKRKLRTNAVYKNIKHIVCSIQFFHTVIGTIKKFIKSARSITQCVHFVIVYLYVYGCTALCWTLAIFQFLNPLHSR